MGPFLLCKRRCYLSYTNVFWRQSVLVASLFKFWAGNLNSQISQPDIHLKFIFWSKIWIYFFKFQKIDIFLFSELEVENFFQQKEILI